MDLDFWVKASSIGSIMAIPALLISIWNLLSPYLSKIKFTIIPESSIQILSGQVSAFNVLFSTIANGPTSKSETFKFIDASVIFPNGDTMNFVAYRYLSETPNGQANQSRNIPIQITGGEAKVITVAFQRAIDIWWIPGEYTVSFGVKDSKGNIIQLSDIRFSLDNDLLNDLVPNGRIVPVPAELI